MTEFCIPNTINNNEKKKNNKSSFFTNLFSFVISHLLYFSYLIFFSHYLFKLLSFLSPLFCTVFLLLLSLTTTFVPLKSILSSKDDFFLTVYTTLLENCRPSFDDDDENENLLAMEEFELYKMVFDVPTTIELNEANPFEDEEFRENPIEFIEERTIDQSESLVIEEETRDTTSPKKVEKDLEKEQYLGSFRSMKKEKEYRKTLACMLFEERHNWSNKNSSNLNKSGNSEEGMDLLWEEIDDETKISKGKLKEEDQEKNKKLRKKDTNKVENLIKKNDYNYKDDQSEESDDYDEIGKICCLQAFKLSAGKMNLSMGRPSFVKFSKTFKGIGWLHSHVRKQVRK